MVHKTKLKLQKTIRVVSVVAPFTGHGPYPNLDLFRVFKFSIFFGELFDSRRLQGEHDWRNIGGATFKFQTTTDLGVAFAPEIWQGAGQFKGENLVSGGAAVP